MVDPYSQQTWTNGVTDANAITMNAIERGIDSAHIGFEARVSIRKAPYGAVGNGVTNDLPAIQRCVTACAADNSPIIIPAGNYRCTDAAFTGSIGPPGSLGVYANTDIYLAPGARLIKDFANSGGETGSFIRNADWTVPCNNARFWGPGHITAADDAATGNIFMVWGNHMLFQDFTIEQWNGGRGIGLAGDNIRAINVKLLGGGGQTGNDGIRFLGGKRFIALGCHVESGDDALQFVTGGPRAQLQFRDKDIEDCAYIGCTGDSSHAKFMVIGLQDGGPNGAPDGEVTMTANSRNNGFIGCRGTSSNLAFLIQNISSSGQIRNPFITDCVVDLANSSAGSGAHSNINGHQATGGIRGLTLTRMVWKNPQRMAFTMLRGGEDTTIQGCKVTRGPNTTPMFKLGGRYTQFLNNVVDNNNGGADAVLVDRQDNEPVTRAANDVHLTTGSNVMTSNAANFTSADVGRSFVVQPDGVASTLLIGQITSVTNGTTAVMSKNATAAQATAVGRLVVYQTLAPINRHVVVAGNHFDRLGLNSFGVSVDDTNIIRIHENLFEQQTAGAKAFELLAGVTGGRIGYNDMGLITATPKYVDNGTGTVFT